MPIDVTTIHDLRTDYPGTPKSVEEQSAPGTQTEICEKPECGEMSYKASGGPAGRKALLTEPDSGIGRAAAAASAREGADVAISYLFAERACAVLVAVGAANRSVRTATAG